MESYNTGKEIVLKGTYEELAVLVSAVEKYVLRNPDAWDIEVASEWLSKLQNPVVSTKFDK